MASRFLRADLCRAYRPVRPKSNPSSGTNALFFAVSTGDCPPSALRSRTRQSSTAAPGTTFVQGLHRVSNHACSSAHSCSSAAYVGAVGVVRSSLAAHSVGAPFPPITPGLQDRCRWRGAGGVVLCTTQQQQAGRRFLSTRRGKAVRQTLKNEQIKAQQILLVLETADGNKETTLVSRQQALAAADAANLDLVQVSSDKDPVVCRLMDFKREEYRKLKQQRASAKRVQKKKEVRLRGMIADHDFERKISDVKKYLERGDMVKVVLEANMSLLKRAGNCLNDLQEKFEAEMEEFEAAVMKPAGGGDGYTRREIDCIPKAVKAPTQKPPRSTAEGPQAAARNGGVRQAREKDKSKPPPPPSTVIDEEIVRDILNGEIDSSGGADDSEGAYDELSEAEASSEESSSSSAEEVGGVETAELEKDEQEQEEGGGETPLQVAGTVVWDVELSRDLAEAVEDDNGDGEWERNEARKRKDRRKREDAKARVREADKFVRRGGARSARKKWRVADDDTHNSGFAGAEWSEELGDSRRSSPRSSGGRGRGRGDGSGRGRGAGTGGRGQVQGGFPRSWTEGGVPRNGGAQQGGFGRRQDGGGGGSTSSGQNDAVQVAHVHR